MGLEGHRDYANGKRQFIGLCGACHVLGAFGGGSAVDLTRRALTYTPEELLAHILNTASHPSPNGALLDRLPQERVLDLLAFVLAGTDASSPFFLQP